MAKLINGRGQLGQELRKLITHRTRDVLIYHTWSVLDKSELAQKKEYNRFTEFVDANKDKKIIFVSTASQRETYYTRYKHLSEAYLLLHCPRGLAIRLPMIIGKGVLPNIKNGKLKPYGEMELITLENSAKEVMKLIHYEGLIKSFSIRGTKVESDLVKEILMVEEA